MGVDKYVKQQKFDGKYFNRWQRKMIFWLKTLGIYYVIVNPLKVPIDEEDNIGDSQVKVSDNTAKKFREDDEFCHGQIMSALSDNLYDLHCEIPAKESWESLNKIYKKRRYW